jgi:hypothetical protein
MAVPGRSACLAAALTLLAAVAGLAGCGGGDGGETSTQLTKAEFVAKGDGICREGDERYAHAQQNPPTTAAGNAALTEKLIQITNDQLSQIRALDAPADVQPALDRYLHAREQGVGILEQALSAARDNDAPAYAAAQAKMAAGQVDRLRLAQAVGFSECSRVGGTASGG